MEQASQHINQKSFDVSIPAASRVWGISSQSGPCASRHPFLSLWIARGPTWWQRLQSGITAKSLALAWLYRSWNTWCASLGPWHPQMQQGNSFTRSRCRRAALSLACGGFWRICLRFIPLRVLVALTGLGAGLKVTKHNVLFRAEHINQFNQIAHLVF